MTRHQMNNRKGRIVNWKYVISEALMERDGGYCKLCNKGIGLDELIEIDHIIEVSNGGRHKFNNFRVVHLWCHKNRHLGAGGGPLNFTPKERKPSISREIRESIRKEIKERIVKGIGEGKPISHIAKDLGLSRPTIYDYLKNTNI